MTEDVSTMMQESSGPPRRRWRIAWLLGLGVLVNYFDRVNLSVSHAALYTTFGISTITFGYLSGAYNWSYALCQLPIGVLLDKFGIRRIGRISTFLWSLASFGAAITPSIGGFFAARFLLGVGEAPTFPSNAKAIGLWFPSRERSFATAIFDGAAKFASAIGVPLIGILLLKVGWRWSFAVTGLISLFYFALFWRIYRDPQDDPALTANERDFIATDDRIFAANESGHASLGYLIRQRKVIGMVLGFGSYNYVFYLLLTWLPSYLSSALHIDLLHSFLYTGVPWLVATAADLIVGGWDCVWPWHSGSREYAQRDDGAHLDQHLHRRALGGVSSRLVCPFVDCASQQRRASRRNHQFLKSAFRDLRAHHHRLS